MEREGDSQFGERETLRTRVATGERTFSLPYSLSFSRDASATSRYFLFSISRSRSYAKVNAMEEQGIRTQERDRNYFGGCIPLSFVVMTIKKSRRQQASANASLTVTRTDGSSRCWLDKVTKPKAGQVSDEMTKRDDEKLRHRRTNL